MRGNWPFCRAESLSVGHKEKFVGRLELVVELTNVCIAGVHLITHVGGVENKSLQVWKGGASRRSESPAFLRSVSADAEMFGVEQESSLGSSVFQWPQ